MQYDFFFAHCAVSLVCWANQPSPYDGCVVGFGGDAEELTMVCTQLRLLVRWALSGQGGQCGSLRPYAGVISLCFDPSDLGDSLHASALALHDLPDPL